MPSFTDQLQRKVVLNGGIPKRIVSLVPSITELLFDLGLESRIAGVTKFCTEPAEACALKPKVGGTKKVHTATIATLQPDLIIANKEENTQEDIKLLSSSFTVWVSDVNTLEDALNMIRSIGAMTETQSVSEAILKTINYNFSRLQQSRQIKTAYLIWNDPMMVAASDTFINSIMERAGLENIFASESRYPETNATELQQKAPELILLSTEPYPFRAEHITDFQTMFPNSIVMSADGTMFSWYGSRMVLAPAYLETIIVNYISATQSAKGQH